jgi:hypothetical protein
MTIKLPHASPGRRFLAYSLASTLLIAGIGFIGSATAGSERSMDATHDRSTLNRRSTTDTGRQTQQKRSTERSTTTSSKRETNQTRTERSNSRDTLNKRSGNDGRDEALEAVERLSWSAPMTREDGSKLYPGEIRGYRIYYKKPNERKFRSIDINDGSLTSYQLGRFKAGIYEFSVTTLDTKGLESRRSQVVSAKLL